MTTIRIGSARKNRRILETFLVFIALKCVISDGYSFKLKVNNNACKQYYQYPIWFASNNCTYNPNVLSTTPNMIKRAGYNSEGHIILTPDGYILQMFRIPTQKSDRRKQPVYLQHGIMTNSAVWVDADKQSLAFYLADLGYDVWLGNTRGNIYSRGHKYLKPTDAKYWHYNLDTMVKYDITLCLEYIANRTGMPGQIIYVGHSMGSTLGFMYAASEPHPERSLLKGIIALAPVVYLDQITEVEALLRVASTAEKALKLLRINGVFYETQYTVIMNYICTSLPFICQKIIETLFGKMTGQFLPEHLLLFYSYWPDGASIQQILHYKQFSESKLFRRYDYGPDGNRAVYGESQPTPYNLSTIRVPVFMYYGRNDWLTSETNLRRIYKELGSSTKLLQEVPKNNDKYKFNHLNFIYAKDIEELFYKDTLNEVLTKHLAI